MKNSQTNQNMEDIKYIFESKFQNNLQVGAKIIKKPIFFNDDPIKEIKQTLLMCELYIPFEIEPNIWIALIVERTSHSMLVIFIVSCNTKKDYGKELQKIFTGVKKYVSIVRENRLTAKNNDDSFVITLENIKNEFDEKKQIKCLSDTEIKSLYPKNPNIPDFYQLDEFEIKKLLSHYFGDEISILEPISNLDEIETELFIWLEGNRFNQNFCIIPCLEDNNNNKYQHWVSLLIDENTVYCYDPLPRSLFTDEIKKKIDEIIGFEYTFIAFNWNIKPIRHDSLAIWMIEMIARYFGFKKETSNEKEMLDYYINLLTEK